ncbi:hypothetical protein I6R01_000934 [Salmonella enterica subsp. enterica serovar Cerro]|nr:hypothetical protein [Salmonella enterica subsp. enterica serovar Cerro]
MASFGADMQMVFPAPAGINRQRSVSWTIIRGVPRASGDKPLMGDYLTYIRQCSPRQRG